MFPDTEDSESRVDDDAGFLKDDSTLVVDTISDIPSYRSQKAHSKEYLQEGGGGSGGGAQPESLLASSSAPRRRASTVVAVARRRTKSVSVADFGALIDKAESLNAVAATQSQGSPASPGRRVRVGGRTSVGFDGSAGNSSTLDLPSNSHDHEDNEGSSDASQDGTSTVGSGSARRQQQLPGGRLKFSTQPLTAGRPLVKQGSSDLPEGQPRSRSHSLAISRRSLGTASAQDAAAVAASVVAAQSVRRSSLPGVTKRRPSTESALSVDTRRRPSFGSSGSPPLSPTTPVGPRRRSVSGGSQSQNQNPGAAASASATPRHRQTLPDLGQRPGSLISGGGYSAARAGRRSSVYNGATAAAGNVQESRRSSMASAGQAAGGLKHANTTGSRLGRGSTFGDDESSSEDETESGDKASYRCIVESELVKIAPFERCAPDFVSHLAKRAEVQLHPQDKKLCVRGEKGDSLFLLLSGSATAFLGGESLSSLGAGDYYGETNLFGIEEVWSMTLVVDAPCAICEVHRQDFIDSLTSHPSELVVFRDILDLVRSRRHLGDMPVAARCPLFRGLSQEAYQMLDSRMVLRTLFKGAKIMQEGMPTGGLYILLHGQAAHEMCDRMLSNSANSGNPGGADIVASSGFDSVDNDNADDDDDDDGLGSSSSDESANSDVVSTKAKDEEKPGAGAGSRVGSKQTTKAGAPDGSPSVNMENLKSYRDIQAKHGGYAYFGEGELVGVQKVASATVTCRTPCHVKILHWKSLESIMNKKPLILQKSPLLAAIHSIQQQKRRSTSKEHQLAGPNDAAFDGLTNSLLATFVQAECSLNFLHFLAKHLEDRFYNEDQELVSEYDCTQRHTLHVLQLGSAKVFQEVVVSGARKVVESPVPIVPGSSFGGIPQMGVPWRPDRAVRVKPVGMWCSSRALHRSIIVRGMELYPEIALKVMRGAKELHSKMDVTEVLLRSKLFAGMHRDPLGEFCQAVEHRIFLPGDQLMEEGSEGTSMFVMVAGVAEILVTRGAMTAEHRQEDQQQQHQQSATQKAKLGRVGERSQGQITSDLSASLTMSSAGSALGSVASATVPGSADGGGSGGVAAGAGAGDGAGGDSSARIVVANLSPGSMFGEMAMLGLTHTRAATVVATGVCMCGEISRAKALAILERYPLEREIFGFIIKQNLENSITPRILKMPLFQGHERKILERIVMHCDRNIHFPNKYIVREGEKDDRMHVLNLGSGRLMKLGCEIFTYGPGKFVGVENMLGFTTICTTSLFSTSICHCLALSRERYGTALSAAAPNAQANAQFLKRQKVIFTQFQQMVQQVTARKRMWTRYQTLLFSQASNDSDGVEIKKNVLHEWHFASQRLGRQRRKEAFEAQQREEMIKHFVRKQHLAHAKALGRDQRRNLVVTLLHSRGDSPERCSPSPGNSPSPSFQRQQQQQQQQRSLTRNGSPKSGGRSPGHHSSILLSPDTRSCSRSRSHNFQRSTLQPYVRVPYHRPDMPTIPTGAINGSRSTGYRSSMHRDAGWANGGFSVDSVGGGNLSDFLPALVPDGLECSGSSAAEDDLNSASSANEQQTDGDGMKGGSSRALARSNSNPSKSAIVAGTYTGLSLDLDHGDDDDEEEEEEEEEEADRSHRGPDPDPSSDPLDLDPNTEVRSPSRKGPGLEVELLRGKGLQESTTHIDSDESKEQQDPQQQQQQQPHLQEHKEQQPQSPSRNSPRRAGTVNNILASLEAQNSRGSATSEFDEDSKWGPESPRGRPSLAPRLSLVGRANTFSSVCSHEGQAKTASGNNSGSAAAGYIQQRRRASMMVKEEPGRSPDDFVSGCKEVASLVPKVDMARKSSWGKLLPAVRTSAAARRSSAGTGAVGPRRSSQSMSTSMTMQQEVARCAELRGSLATVFNDPCSSSQGASQMASKRLAHTSGGPWTERGARLRALGPPDGLKITSGGGGISRAALLKAMQECKRQPPVLPAPA